MNKKMLQEIEDAVSQLDEVGGGHRLTVLVKQAEKDTDKLMKGLKHLHAALRSSSKGKALSRNDAKQLWNIVTLVASGVEKLDDDLSKLVIKLNELL